MAIVFYTRFKGVRLEVAWPVFMKQLGQQAISVKPTRTWLDAIKPTAYLGFDFEN